MRFTGTFEELKERLSKISDQGIWVDLNDNQKQFKKKDGAILNWFISTGTISFQGKSGPSKKLRDIVNILVYDDKSNGRIDIIDKNEDINNGASSGDDQSNFTTDEDSIANNSFSDSEVVIGLVGAVGTDLSPVVRLIKDRLKAFKYGSDEIRVSNDVIGNLRKINSPSDNYDRINLFMNEGNNLRKNSSDYSILSLGVAGIINKKRDDANSDYLKRHAFIINSLKHPKEVERLRQIYSNGFYLIGVYADEKRRYDYLTDYLLIESTKADELITRDADESEKYGQHTRDTFHLSDFFINFDGDTDKFQNDVWRILDLIFGEPHITPTFDEYAMFMAFSAALRSADLSRQVGSVIAKDNCIVSTGANDVPKAFGGLYWPEYDSERKEIVDASDGRDFMRGYDSNYIEKKKIIDDILSEIPGSDRDKFEEFLNKNSKIKDITEYGRVVHAEMEAILACSRNGVSTKGAELFCTTFPCHNCAKHIIASGIKRVVYVEPYPKSKAFEFHTDSITFDKNDKARVVFEPFVGVGPRSFFNLFSMSLGSGYGLERKNKDGTKIVLNKKDGRLRIQMLPFSYKESESIALRLLNKLIKVNKLLEGIDG